MNTNSPLITEMKDKAYRDAYVKSQITTGLPFQIRSLRKSRGPEWTQDYLAEQSGMAQPRISDLERVGGRFPNLETLCRIAAGLDVAVLVRFVPFSELIEWNEYFDPENFNIKTFAQELESNEHEEMAPMTADLDPDEIRKFCEEVEKRADEPTRHGMSTRQAISSAYNELKGELLG